ncbi:hypothetical protein AMEX_G14006, partial [Astyanax mexicanus]|uniref:Uncharacterized protein n=2 Tax=Astyanax mexicanus TaxID=7994 RepID=A0A3B1KM86_ASTMX
AQKTDHVCSEVNTQNGDTLRNDFKEDQSVKAYLNPSTPAFAYSIWYRSAGRINHRHETNKAQVLSGEVHIICVKLEALWKLFLRKIVVTETCGKKIK